MLATEAGAPAGPFLDLSEEQWRNAVDSLLMSNVRFLRESVPLMKERGGGSIVNIASISVKQPIPNLALSNSIRAAVVGLAKTLASELAPMKDDVENPNIVKVVTDPNGFALYSGVHNSHIFVSRWAVAYRPFGSAAWCAQASYRILSGNGSEAVWNDRNTMIFDQFSEQFGGSFRTRHLSVIPESCISRLKWVGRNVFGSNRKQLVNKRFYAPSARSGLPKEFIRLEPWEAEYLFLLASRAKRGIVEIGRLLGGSTFLLACANDQTPVYSIDIEPPDDTQLNTLLQQHQCGENVKLIVGDSQHTDYPEIKEFDLLFIDGDHSYQGCMNDLDNWYPKLASGGHVILHDCYFGCEVQDAVVDFIQRQDVQIVRSPYIIRSHWQTSYGSMVHFIKREASAARAA